MGASCSSPVDQPAPGAQLERVEFVVSSRDPEVADHYVAALYTGGTVPRIALPEDGALEFSVRRIQVGGLSTNRVRHSGAGRVVAAMLPGLTALRATAGHAQTTTGSTQVSFGPGDTPLLPSGVPVGLGWGDLHVAFVQFPADMATWGARERGVEVAGVAFTGTAPRTKALGRYWSGLLDIAHRELNAPDTALTDPLALDGLLRALGGAAITVFPNTTDQLTPARAGRAEPAVVRRAVQYIDANAHLPIGADDIAAAAHIGVRGLQQAFRRHREQSPLDYLRTVRLERAHRDLVAGHPGHATVQAIARRWGFANAGRFAGYYRAAYGRAPGETLNH